MRKLETETRKLKNLLCKKDNDYKRLKKQNTIAPKIIQSDLKGLIRAGKPPTFLREKSELYEMFKIVVTKLLLIFFQIIHFSKMYRKGAGKI